MNKAASSVNQSAPRNSYNLRIFLLLCVLTLAIGSVGFRLFYLQVVHHGYYKALADNQHTGEGVILPKRGQIYFSPFAQGTPLLVATNVVRYTVSASIKNITDADKTASKLAPILEISKTDLYKSLTSTSNYVVLKKQVSEADGKKIQELKLAGINLEQNTERLYPEKNLAAQVLGFLGFKDNERVGQYGVEGKYEDRLAGQKGYLGSKKDALGRMIATSDSDFLPARDGDDIYLTIDPSIQIKAQAALKTAVDTHGADGGSVVIMDPRSGAVMAMASYPDYDPNAYNKVSDLSIFSNKILTGEYEPGSVFKPITMAAALNEGKVTPETTFIDAGSVQIDDKTIKNSDPTPLGEQNMVQVLRESLNTGAYFVQQQIGNETFKKYVERFGFGKPVEFDLSAPAAGNLKNLNQKGNVFFATASYGQGITTTPLQMIQSYTAIANGGKMVTPYIINKIVHPDGTEEYPERPAAKDIIQPKTAATVSAMLVEVVENGHGKRAAVPGYYIAGKTGTAQVAYTNRAGYDPTKNIGTFIGFGPVEDPKFLMLVRIDHPKSVKFAESTAAPPFGEIASFILNYLQVPPSR